MSSDTRRLEVMEAALLIVTQGAAHLEWVTDATNTEVGNHLLVGHGVTIGGNVAFKRQTHRLLHAGSHGAQI